MFDGYLFCKEIEKSLFTRLSQKWEKMWTFEKSSGCKDVSRGNELQGTSLTTNSSIMCSKKGSTSAVGLSDGYKTVRIKRRRPATTDRGSKMGVNLRKEFTHFVSNSPCYHFLQIFTETTNITIVFEIEFLSRSIRGRSSQCIWTLE